MFLHFDIKYDRGFNSEFLDDFHIGNYEIEALFYGENHVIYMNDSSFFVIGYTGFRMLTADFSLDYSQNLITIESIKIAQAHEINQLYCGKVAQ